MGAPMKPKKLTNASARRTARVMRDDQWRFMEMVADHGTLWFCNWNKSGRDEAADELRTSLIGGMNIGAWIDAHPDWFVVGEWSDARYAMPVQLTDAGRAALADRAPYDMEPIMGGMVEPGWTAIPSAQQHARTSPRAAG
jgi:hypothetical protein